MDSEIKRTTWSGKVPVAFALAADAASGHSAGPDDTFYMLIPRVAYLSLVTAKVQAHFQLPSTGSLGSMWFEHKGTPLKWNYPIGLLFDCLGQPDELPWQITVHPKDPPSEIIPCEDLAVVESYFVNRLKEASYLKHGTTQIDGLQSDMDKKCLWRGLIQDDYDQFQRVNERLMTCKDGHWFKRIPVRVYHIEETDGRRQITVLDEPFDSTNEDGTFHTLHDLIRNLALSSPPEKVVIQGIQPPLNTPLQWLSEHVSYPDNFLHIALLPSKASTSA